MGGRGLVPSPPFENSILLTLHVYIVKLPNIGLGHPPPPLSRQKHYATISLSPHPLTPTPGGKKIWICTWIIWMMSPYSLKGFFKQLHGGN